MSKGTVRPAPQEDIRHFRAMGSICRQQAVLHPEASWNWLSQAEKWEDLAEAAAPSIDMSRQAPAPIVFLKAS